MTIGAHDPTVTIAELIDSRRATCTNCGWSDHGAGLRLYAKLHALNFGHRVTITEIRIEQVETAPTLKVVT